MSTEGFDPTKVRIFGGRFTFNERSECPPGMSPNCNDVEFGLNAVRSRAGLGLRLTDASGVNGLKSFYPQDRVRRLAILENNGDFALESPEGTIAARLTTGIAKGAIMSAKYAFNRLWMCFSDGKRPLDYPWAFEPSAVGGYANGELLSATAPNLYGEAITITQSGAGTTVDGGRFFFITEEDRYGFFTGQSVVFSMVGAGGLKFVIANIPTAPNETSAIRGAVAKRRLWCTVAGGLGSFYSLGTFVFDNTASTITVDFTDTTLQSSGRLYDDYMTQVPAPPAIGVHSFNNRLAYYGVYDGVPTQLALFSSIPAWVTANGQLLGPANFDFSTAVPPTATHYTWGQWYCETAAAASGTSIVTGAGSAAEGTRSRSCLRLSSNGSTFAGAVRFDTAGKVTNQDATPSYYLTPGHRYGLLIRIKKGANWTSGAAKFSLTQVGAANSGVLASASILPSSLSTDWQIVDIPPATFAVDGGEWTTSNAFVSAFLQFYPLYPNASADFFVDWVRPYDAAAKFQGSILWWSLFDQPSAFDLVKSPQAINPGDGEEIRCVFEQNGNTYIAKEHSLWVTADNGQDPSSWAVDNVSFLVGTPSLHGVALGPEFAIIASRDGAYYFDSGAMNKLSLEIQPEWDAIDWTQGHLIHVTLDAKLQRVRIAVPTSDVQGQCSKVFVLDYVEGWQSGHGNNGSGRKWSFDTVQTSCSEIAERDDLSSRPVYGGRRSSSNDANVTFASGWTQLGNRAPGITGSQGDPLGATAASLWDYGTHGTCRASYTTAVSVAAGGYFVASFWVKALVGEGGGNTGFVRDPFGLADVPFTITPSWQRVVAIFGPAPNGTLFEVIDIDFGTSGSSDFFFSLFGPQLQAGQYDKGWHAYGATSTESGFISQPTADLAGVPGWKTSDWDGPILPVYEFAPFGLELGRSNFNKIIARIRGLGQLAAYWVQPDNQVTALNAGAFPQMNSNPLNDVEMGGQAQGTFIGVRLSTSGIASWFSLKRFGCFSKEHEGAPTRGKT